MKKKTFISTIRTFFTVLICLFAAVLLWLYVNYSDGTGAEALNSLCNAIGAFL